MKSTRVSRGEPPGVIDATERMAECLLIWRGCHFLDMKHARTEALEGQLIDTLAREHIKPTREIVRHLFTVRHVFS